MASISGEDIWAIFNEGWEAAKAGRPATDNPYPDADGDVFNGAKRQLWAEGWQTRHDDPVTARARPER